MSIRVGDLYLGKTPATEDTRDLKLVRYTETLPPLPDGPLGHQSLIGTDAWGMNGNNRAGDCVWAGAAHETLLWNVERHRQVTITDDDSLADYTAVTGYNPDDPSTDRGTDMRNALIYRRKTGIRDSTDRRHKIHAFTALDAGNLDQIKQSVWLFSVAAVGIEFPTTAMDQFNAGKPWSVVSGASIEGGHYVPVVGYDPTAGMFLCVTWGRLQPVEAAFLVKYCDEAFAPLSSENRLRGKTLEGFDATQLAADLAGL